MSLSSFPRRPIRSFVRREGRMTAAQQRALTERWPAYGIGDGIEPRAAAPLDFATLFGRTAPVTLEIGFGNGEALLAMASAHPERDFLGIEVHRPGVGQLLNGLAVHGLSNVRVAIDDAREFLSQRVPETSLDAVHLFFPDPWPKKRHHKRRLVQPDFVTLVHRRLKPGGVWRLATDWEDYAQHMLAVLSAEPGLANLADEAGFVPRPEERPLTRFERRGQKLGHRVRDLAFRRVD